MKPIHQHDCDHCIYLGSDKELNSDFYYCEQEGHACLSTLIARYGVDGEYSSGFSFVMSSVPLNKALKLAIEKNVMRLDIISHIKHEQDKWFKYCEGDKSYAEGIAKRWEGHERFIIK